MPASFCVDLVAITCVQKIWLLLPWPVPFCSCFHNPADLHEREQAKQGRRGGGGEGSYAIVHICNTQTLSTEFATRTCMCDTHLLGKAYTERLRIRDKVCVAQHTLARNLELDV